MTNLSDLPAAAAADGTERGIVNQGSGNGTTSLLSAAQTVVNRASGTDALALGTGATATAPRGVAIGNTASTNNVFNAVAIGNQASVTATTGVAIGHASSALAALSTAVGPEAVANTAYSLATGFSASATGAYSCALGGEATANGAYACAVGGQAQATAAGAVAIGGQTANALANTVSIGARGLVLLESSGLGSPPANSGMLFVEDDGASKSRLVIKWPDGTTEVLATQA